MRRPILITAAILLALGAVEATAWWWMHPAPTGLNQSVLAYQPGIGDRRSEIGIQKPLAAATAKSESLTGWPKGSEANQEEADVASQGSSPTSSLSIINPQSSISPASSLSTINLQLSTSPLTPLPEVYQQAAPMLRCTGGQVFHSQLDDTLGLHLAFFEWDGTDTGSVLEAFRHMPEACMGSIGMTLVEKRAPRTYVVRREETGGGEQASEVRGQRSANAIAQNTSSSDHRSLITAHSLVFDHTIFREPGNGRGPVAIGPQVHAFRAVWVAGLKSSDARKGIGGDEFDRLRTIRLKSALSRFRPTHARVIQAAVRGAANGDAAWQAFESAMLKDLKFQ